MGAAENAVTRSVLGAIALHAAGGHPAVFVRVQAGMIRIGDRLIRMAAAGTADELLQSLEQEIALLREREQLLGDKIGKGIELRARDEGQRSGKEISTALADSIEEGITDGFRNSRSITQIFLDELKAQFGKTILRPLIQPVAEAGNGLIGDLLTSLLSNFAGGGGMGITAGDSPLSSTGETIRGRRAKGGPVYAGNGEYIVGEEGAERFRPNSAGRIIPNGAGGGPAPVGVQLVNNGPPMSARATSQQTDTGTLVRIVLDAVGADLASGTGPASRGLRARGVNLNRNLPRRA